MSASSSRPVSRANKDLLVNDKVFAKADTAKVLKHMKLS